MTTEFVHFFVEEFSAEAFLEKILPGILGRIDYRINRFLCKDDLLAKLEQRLRGLAWVPPSHKIVVLVDRDDDDASPLRRKLDDTARRVGFEVHSKRSQGRFQVANRLAIEELEAWFFGESEALRACYPKVPPTLQKREGFRNPDTIAGGTWEALERVLQTAGYFKGGLRKIELARAVGSRFQPERCVSESFREFHAVLREIAS